VQTLGYLLTYTMAFWSHIWVIIPLESYNSWLHLHFSWYSFWPEKWIKPRPSVILNFLIEKAAEHRIFEKCMIRIPFTLFMVRIISIFLKANLVKSLKVWKFNCDFINILTPLQLHRNGVLSIARVANEMQAHMFSTRLRSRNLFDISLGFLNNMTSRLVTMYFNLVMY
jgi:hypothetical protein